MWAEINAYYTVNNTSATIKLNSCDGYASECGTSLYHTQSSPYTFIFWTITSQVASLWALIFYAVSVKTEALRCFDLWHKSSPRTDKHFKMENSAGCVTLQQSVVWYFDAFFTEKQKENIDLIKYWLGFRQVSSTAVKSCNMLFLPFVCHVKAFNKTEGHMEQRKLLPLDYYI